MQLVAQVLGAARADLHAHDLPEAPAAQLVLDGLQQVGGVVGDLQVSIAGDPEHVVLDDFHPRKQRVQVVGDHVLQGHQRDLVGVCRLHSHKARQNLGGNLHAREHGLAVDRVSDQHREAERQVGDVGKRPSRSDRQGGERREDDSPEVQRQLRALALVELLNADHVDVLLGQRRTQLAFEAVAQARSQPQHLLADQGDRLRGGEPVLAGGSHARVDLVVQAGDAHHVVLVEVGRVDRAELDPLQQGFRLVLGELQHAVIEVEPGQLAVDIQRRILQMEGLALLIMVVVEHRCDHATPFPSPAR